MTDVTQQSAEPRVRTREPQPPTPSGNGQQQQPSQGQATPAAQPEGPWIGKLPLRKPVNAHGEMVSELTFREPTGGDIADCGNPIVPGGTGRMQFDGPVMTEMMARLAVVTPKTIRDLHPKDWTNGAYMIAGFFLPDM